MDCSPSSLDFAAAYQRCRFTGREIRRAIKSRQRLLPYWGQASVIGPAPLPFFAGNASMWWSTASVVKIINGRRTPPTTLAAGTNVSILSRQHSYVPAASRHTRLSNLNNQICSSPGHFGSTTMASATNGAQVVKSFVGFNRTNRQFLSMAEVTGQPANSVEQIALRWNSNRDVIVPGAGSRHWSVRAGKQLESWPRTPGPWGRPVFAHLLVTALARLHNTNAHPADQRPC